MGSPIALWLANKDWDNWKDDVMSIEKVDDDLPTVTLPRPGHADLAGVQKFRFKDIRDVIERSSARETAMRVALAAICRKFLREFDIEVASHVIQIGSVSCDPQRSTDLNHLNAAADESPVRCLDPKASQAMVNLIDATRKEGDSLGGIFEVLVSGVPPGLGSHTHWDRKLDGRLAGAMMSINAMKAVAIGDGLNTADRPGSQVHDEIEPAPNGYRRKTNHAGGIEGGMSNGEQLVVQVAMKPIPTLAKALQSVDIHSREIRPAHRERTDSCAVPAAAVIGEAMAALVVADAFLEKFGGDSMSEIKDHIKASLG
jgi:chorismate synthase